MSGLWLCVLGIGLLSVNAACPGTATPADTSDDSISWMIIGMARNAPTPMTVNDTAIHERRETTEQNSPIDPIRITCENNVQYAAHT